METKRFSAWGDLGKLALAFLVGTLAAGVVVAVVIAVSGGSVSLTSGVTMFVTYTLQFALAIVLGIVWLRRRGGVRLRFGVSWGHAPVILGGIVLMTAMGIVLEPLINLFPEHYLETLNNAIGTGGWAILTTVVAAPVLEEIFFRGLVLERLAGKWRAPAAVGASALLFCAAHLPILPQMVYAFFVAFLLGYLYLMTRSLVPMIVMHAINNGIAYMQLQIYGTQMPDTREMIGNDTLYWAIYAASAVILVLSVVYMVLRVGTKTPEIALDEKTADE
jgi:membrane protease YdiL (CAAX protease family)